MSLIPHYYFHRSIFDWDLPLWTDHWIDFDHHMALMDHHFHRDLFFHRPLYFSRPLFTKWCDIEDEHLSHFDKLKSSDFPKVSEDGKSVSLKLNLPDHIDPKKIK
jgi:hypothetical protein